MPRIEVKRGAVDLMSTALATAPEVPHCSHDSRLFNVRRRRNGDRHDANDKDEAQWITRMRLSWVTLAK